MVTEEGVEPPTSRIWVVRSNQLSYSAKKNKISYILKDSPQPQVLFSFGLLKTNREESLSVADYIIVLKNGKIIEEGNAEYVFNFPKNTYTKNLLSSVI